MCEVADQATELAEALRKTAALLNVPPPSSSPPPVELDPHKVFDFLTFFGAPHGCGHG